jgi:hypothetical protein
MSFAASVSYEPAEERRLMMENIEFVELIKIRKALESIDRFIFLGSAVLIGVVIAIAIILGTKL